MASASTSGDAKANKNMEEGETSSKVSLPALSSTISRIKKHVNLERQAYVKAKTEANSEKLQHFCAHLLELSSSRARKNNTQSEKDMLNIRIQKALNKFGADASSADQEGTSVQDDSSAPIVVGSTAGSKNVVKPVRLQTVQRTPPYTTWIFLDRNQRMAEDQSVVGRRRIYYDSAGNEALICSDSEEEQVEEEEDKRDFSKGDDFVIRTTVQEHGISKAVWKALADCLDAKVNEVEARYELLLKEAERTDPYEKKAFNNGQDLDGTKLEDDIFQAKDLSSAMDSFDKLFCRRCLVFDCRLHGCSQLVVIPSEKQPPLNRTGELASFPCGPCCFHLPRLSSPDQGCSLVGNVRSMALQPAFSATADSLESISQTGAEKGSTRNQKQEDIDKAATGAGIVTDVSATKPAEKSLLQPPEHSKKGIKDKRVNALRKLLKRKAGRGTDDDSHEARKKHQTEAPHSEAEEGAGISKGEAENTCPDSNVFSEKVVSKKFYTQKKMKKGIQITKVKRALAPIKESGDDGKLENVQNLDSLGKDLAVGDSNWNSLEKELYQKGLQIFGRDSCLIAKNLLKGLKSCAEVGEFMQLEAAANWRLGEETKLQQDGSGKTQLGDSLDIEVSRSRLYNGRRRGRVRRLKYTWKSVPAIRKRLVDGKEGCRQYAPCSCLYTCGKQCPCLRNGTYCEKYCGCSKGCKNRFRGCHCAKSQCCSRQCPCFAAGRECDPDVCRNCWVGCGDGTQGGPPSQGATYLCRNMKLLLKQQQRVLLGRSDVAGWGAFLKSPVSKHEYLGEYTGELISHREADKRGKIYDRENSSFLFNLNDQYVLDACRKGDKLKFANHSPNPNCYAKVIMVAGDHRVGIFAKERVAAGEELFYDYRYEADRAPPWARKPEDGHKHDEFASGSGRAQKTA